MNQWRCARAALVAELWESKLAGRKSSETVSASFHFLIRRAKDKKGNEYDVPFSEEEFGGLCGSIKSRPKTDLKNKKVVDRLKLGLDVPLEKMEVINGRTVFGVFRAPYTGHAYDNSARGTIPADSVSLRQFHYLLYFADSGRIYVGCQYLGQFGGYQVLAKALRGLLPDHSSIQSRTFRLDATHYQNAKAKEVKVEFARKPKSIVAKNLFGTGGVITFKKGDKNDNFELEVQNRLFPYIGKTPSAVKKALAKLLSDNDLLDVSDDDIEDCTVLANVDGKMKTIYMIDGGNFATKFPLEVPLKDDGHPGYDQTKDAMLNLLKEAVISRKEDV